MHLICIDSTYFMTLYVVTWIILPWLISPTLCPVETNLSLSWDVRVAQILLTLLLQTSWIFIAPGKGYCFVSCITLSLTHSFFLSLSPCTLTLLFLSLLCFCPLTHSLPMVVLVAQILRTLSCLITLSYSHKHLSLYHTLFQVVLLAKDSPESFFHAYSFTLSWVVKVALFLPSPSPSPSFITTTHTHTLTLFHLLSLTLSHTLSH